jgi:hypothetical protein
MYGDTKIDYCTYPIDIHILQNIIYWHQSHWNKLLRVDPEHILFVEPVWELIGDYAFGIDFEHPLIPTFHINSNKPTSVYDTLTRWFYGFDTKTRKFRFGLWDALEDPR